MIRSGIPGTFVALVFRLGSRIIITKTPIPDSILGIMSHYWQWIPVVIIGTLSCRNDLIDKSFEKTKSLCRNKDSVVFAVSLVLVVFILIVKTIVQYKTNNYSNFDSFIILPFTVVLTNVLYILFCSTSVFAKKFIAVLSKLGGVSLYMWLLHCILRYDAVQSILYSLRLPFLILLVAIVVMYFVAKCISKIDAFVHRLITRTVKYE